MKDAVGQAGFQRSQALAARAPRSGCLRSSLPVCSKTAAQPEANALTLVNEVKKGFVRFWESANLVINLPHQV